MGKTYDIRTDHGEKYGLLQFTVKPIIYTGCIVKENISLFKVDGIYTNREFYGITSDQIRLPEPQYLSTLLWKPGILINEKGQTEFSFYTGDITGKFRIVIQGVSNKDMIFGESSFMVK